MSRIEGLEYVATFEESVIVSSRLIGATWAFRAQIHLVGRLPGRLVKGTLGHV